MANDQSSFLEQRKQGKGWYDLFSRGARDWLRHNEKVQDAVRENLPELISGADILGQGGERTVKVPVRFLEHFRFRLADSNERSGAGQGQGKPGDVLARPAQQGPGKGKGGNDEGGYQFVLELKVDDIVEWLWEELKLPNLKMKTGGLREEDYVREGWNRRGVRSRLIGGARSKKPSSAAPSRRMVRPSVTRICAIGSWWCASSRPRKRWCSLLWTCHPA